MSKALELRLIVPDFILEAVQAVARTWGAKHSPMPMGLTSNSLRPKAGVKMQVSRHSRWASEYNRWTQPPGKIWCHKPGLKKGPGGGLQNGDGQKSNRVFLNPGQRAAWQGSLIDPARCLPHVRFSANAALLHLASPAPGRLRKMQ